MVRTLIIFPDGRELSSGTEGAAVESFHLTESVNSGQDLTLGSVCSAVVEMTLLSPQELSLSAGDAFYLYRFRKGARKKVGDFIIQETKRISANRLKIIAYDRISLLDQDLTAWVSGLKEWPYTLMQFADMVCHRCGLKLANDWLMNGNYLINKFSAGQVTGRKLMGWIGELAGGFCRANIEGSLKVDWYAPTNITIRPDGERCYFQGSLHYQQQAVEPVAKVQFRQSSDDVGIAYPEAVSSANTYVISGNPLVAEDSADNLVKIAQTLYDRLSAVSYTPCKVSIPVEFALSVGEIISVITPEGDPLTVYIMNRTQSGNKEVMEATGSVTRNNNSIANEQILRNLSGKVLNLKMTMDGLQAENRDAAGKIASLSMDVSGIASEVSRQQTDNQSIKTQLTSLSQKADSMEIRVQQIMDNGTAKVQTETGFTFDQRGLTISKTGSQMENLLDETGMYVKRNGEVILQANQDGVCAVDVTVRNYLIVGEHARFEDYSNGTDHKRTACFWI